MPRPGRVKRRRARVISQGSRHPQFRNHGRCLMWIDRHGRRPRNARSYSGASTRPVRRVSCQPWLDLLENRQLLTASLQPIPAVTVPALQGYTVPLLANSGAKDAQTFTVTSNNPDIGASVSARSLLDARRRLQRHGKAIGKLHGLFDVPTFPELDTQHRQYDPGVYQRWVLRELR